MSRTLRPSEMLAGLKAKHGIDVTPQAVIKWRESGCPHDVGERCGQPMHLYDLDEVYTWYRENRGYRRRGGKRKNAGRKRPPTAEEQVYQNQMHKAELERQIAERSTAPPGALRLDDCLRLTREELITLVERADLAGLSAAALDHFERFQKAIKQDIETRERQGQLVDAAEVRRAWTSRAAEIRMRLLAIPAHATAEVMARLNLPPDQAPVLKDVLTKAVEAALNGAADAMTSAA